MSGSFSPIRNVLISVSDKTGLESLAMHLHERGARLFSTGGTHQFLRSLSLPVETVESVTKTPEILEGRVKTLHPQIFGGILARRNHPPDLKTCEETQTPLFDLIIVNLYPFFDHLGKPSAEQVDHVDIGGPSLIRAAAKNHEWVTILSDPSDYSEFINQTKTRLETPFIFRKQMAQKSFMRVSDYDRLIAQQWDESPVDFFPKEISLRPQLPLRYGENPHQKGAWVGRPNWKLLQGKELSFNNLLDSEAAVRICHDFSWAACSIIKHNNPCGVAWSSEAPPQSGPSLFSKALASDPKSAFGGIVATNYEVQESEAQKMTEMFLECVIAPQFSERALSVLKSKPNLRVIAYPDPVFTSFEMKEALGGYLVQERNERGTGVSFEPMTGQGAPSPQLSQDMIASWLVCKHTKSNAIVISRDQQTWGIGAGQVSRIDALEVAISKAHGHLDGAIIASDAFFPFRDSVDRLVGFGIRALIQPGGSKKDPEVIEACRQHQIPLFFTGERHFRH